jgi:hypothetical protein
MLGNNGSAFKGNNESKYKKLKKIDRPRQENYKNNKKVLDIELNKFHLDEFQTIRIKISILLTFIIPLIAVILSYSIYLSYENQKLVKIEDDIKLKLIQVIDAIDKDISQIFKLSKEENTFIVCTI